MVREVDDMSLADNAQAAVGPREVRAASGRLAGTRALATRARLLDCTRELLAGRSYRDLTAIEIARECGTSPATFYQYFPDVESAVLTVAAELAAHRGELSEIVRSANWRDRTAAATAARDLARAFMDFWGRHRSVLRVMDLSSAEGDMRFRTLRTELLNDVTNALAEAIADVRDPRRPGHLDPGTDPMAVAAVLVSMLAHVASHREGLETWGIASADTEAVMADIVCEAVAGRPSRRGS
jgi:AcrR family transcriptional regulator